VGALALARVLLQSRCSAGARMFDADPSGDCQLPVVGLVLFAIWQITGNNAWIEEFSRVPGALVLVLAGGQLACYSAYGYAVDSFPGSRCVGPGSGLLSCGAGGW
jgi:hypothetical protein